jgi:hypothetical protein
MERSDNKSYAVMAGGANPADRHRTLKFITSSFVVIKGQMRKII